MINPIGTLLSNAGKISNTNTGNPTSGFSNLLNGLNNSITTMNNNQNNVQNQVQNVIDGNSNNTQGVLIDLQKTQLEMQLASVIRDKLTTAYDTFMQMQV